MSGIEWGRWRCDMICWNAWANTCNIWFKHTQLFSGGRHCGNTQMAWLTVAERSFDLLNFLQFLSWWYHGIISSYHLQLQSVWVSPVTWKHPRCTRNGSSAASDFVDGSLKLSSLQNRCMWPRKDPSLATQICSFKWDRMQTKKQL